MIHLWIGYKRANSLRAWECGRCKAVWPKETHPEVLEGCVGKRFTVKQWLERRAKEKANA